MDISILVSSFAAWIINGTKVQHGYEYKYADRFSGVLCVCTINLCLSASRNYKQENSMYVKRLFA